MTHDEVTPRLTDHARERCAEMGISTKVAKRVWQNRGTTWPLVEQEPRIMATSPDVPGYAVVVDPTGWAGVGTVPVIVTVMFDCVDEYVRNGETYVVVEKERGVA